MRDFSYVRGNDVSAAVAAIAAGSGAKLIAGGTDLVNLLKEGIEQPGLLVDISRLPLTEIEAGPGGLRLGALARMSDVAAHPAVRRDYPGIARALELSASAQLRNMATMGGNLMQRTRCPYFRAEHDLPCNKRRPGSGCGALDAGQTRSAALFGASGACVATHPSDVAVMLAALDASVQIAGPHSGRAVPLVEFYRLPGDQPQRDTVLAFDEMIIGIDVPASPVAARSCYVKARERASYEFALVSAAVGVEVDGNVIRHARVALGGMAPRPLRVPAWERALAGVPAETEAVRAALRAAAEAAFADARPLPGSEFKVALAEQVVLRAVEEVIG